MTLDNALGVSLLRDAGIVGAVYAPSRTGLEKDYFDAVASTRSLLASSGVHDFDLQPRGTKASGRVVMLCDVDAVSPRDAAFFRTNRGDRRIRVSGLNSWIKADDLLAFVPVGSVLHLMNLENARTVDALKDNASTLRHLLKSGVALASSEDERSADPRTLTTIYARRGQAGFRQRLFKQLGQRCVVSGTVYSPLLEAAHIVPFAESYSHEATNGLLLRTDLHTLFDLNQMTIEPTGRTRLAPALSGVAEYGPFDRTPSFLTAEQLAARSAMLQRHNSRCAWL